MVEERTEEPKSATTTTELKDLGANCPEVVKTGPGFYRLCVLNGRYN
jgi:hypothetical protein